MKSPCKRIDPIYGLLLLWLGCFSLSAVGQSHRLQPPILVIDTLEHNLWLTPYLEVFEDETSALTIEDVSQMEFAGRFQPVDTFFNASHHTHTIWGRITIQSLLGKPSYWVIGDYGSSGFLEMYARDSSENWAIKRSGAYVPGKDRDLVKYDFISLGLVLAPHTTKTYYFSVKEINHSTPTLRLKLHDKNSWLAFSREQVNVVIAGFVAILVIMFLYSFMVFLTSKEITYLHYSLYIASLAGFIMFAGGPHEIHGFPILKEYLLFLCLSGISIFYFQFGRSFLDTPKLIPHWDKWIVRYIGMRLVLLLVQMGLIYFTFNISLVATIEFSFFLVDAVFALILCVILARSKSIIARFFIGGTVNVFGFGFVFFTIGLFVGYNGSLGLFGSLVAEILVFSLGLGYKMRISEKEKLAAQAEKLASQEALNQELSKINTAFGRFVPHEFLKSLGYESVLEVNLGDGVEKEVTVFFSDIRSYTTLSEGMSPRENFDFLNAYLGRVGPIITAHNGFVNQYYGDGIMALFMQSPNDAIAAAQEAHQAIDIFNQELVADGKQPIRIGIGLHKGPLLMGVIGDTLRLEAGVVSDTVNTASRMEGLTKHFGVNTLVSEHCVDSSSLGSLFRYLGKVQVKGRKEAIGVYDYFGGDAPEIQRAKQETLDDFHQGLSAYYAQSFVDAAHTFDRVLTVFPDDKTSQRYLTQAKQYLLEGTPKGWTGVEQMVEK